MKLVTIAATAALTAGAFAFAPAPPAAPDAAPPTPDFGATVADDGTLVRTVDGRVDRTGLLPGEDVRDLATWVRAERRTVEAGGVTTIAAADACGGLDEPAVAGLDPECEEGEEQGLGSFSSFGPAGDLDGDGWDDVLEERWSIFGGATELIARSGRGAAELWRVADDRADDGFGFTFAIPDVDGDGTGDLLTVRYGMPAMEGGGSCSPVRCEFSDRYEEERRFIARSGADGAEIGELTSTMVFAFEDAWTAVEQGPAIVAESEGSFTIEGLLTALAPIDLTGDGTHRLLMGTLSIGDGWRQLVADAATPAGYVGGFVDRSEVSVATSVSLVDLAAGTTESVADTEQDGLATFPTVVLLGDVDALLVDRFEAAAGARHAACLWAAEVFRCGSPDGDTDGVAPTRARLDAHGTVWEQPLDGTSMFVYEAGGDLTGDGVPDLLDARIDLDTYDDVTGAIDAATGELLWTAPVLGGYAREGDLTGVRFAYEDQSGEDGYRFRITGHVSRVDGTTGAVRDEREVAAVVDSEDGDTAQWAFISMGLVPIAGAATDLVVIAEELLLEEVETYEECFTYEDENGDTVEECWEYTEYEVVDIDGELRGVDGASLADLFVRATSGEFLVDVVDLDADGPAELLLETFDFETYTGTTTAERLDGSVLWELGEEQHAAGMLATPVTPTVVVVDAMAGTLDGRDGADLTLRWSLPLFG